VYWTDFSLAIPTDITYKFAIFSPPLQRQRGKNYSVREAVCKYSYGELSTYFKDYSLIGLHCSKQMKLFSEIRVFLHHKRVLKLVMNVQGLISVISP
jgi:hypothetical protein